MLIREFKLTHNSENGSDTIEFNSSVELNNYYKWLCRIYPRSESSLTYDHDNGELVHVSFTTNPLLMSMMM